MAKQGEIECAGATENEFDEVCKSVVDDEDEEPYCKCGEPNTQDMIGCDGPTCEYEWWHYACAGLTEEDIPDGEWNCPECSGASKTPSTFVS